MNQCQDHKQFLPVVDHLHCLAQQCINYLRCAPRHQFCTEWLLCCHHPASHLSGCNLVPLIPKHCCCQLPQWAVHLCCSTNTHSCIRHTSPHHPVDNKWLHSIVLQIPNQATRYPICFHPALRCQQIHLHSVHPYRSKDWIHHTSQCHFFCI